MILVAVFCCFGKQRVEKFIINVPLGKGKFKLFIFHVRTLWYTIDPLG